MLRFLLLTALLVTTWPAGGVARAASSPTVSVLETWPRGDDVTLAPGSNFYLRIGYSSDQPVSIWARPYFAGKQVAAGSNPSRSYRGSGEALGWFFLMKPGDRVDEIRILVGDGSTSGSKLLASRRVGIIASAGAGTGEAPPEWVARMQRQEADAQQADIEMRQANPPGAADMLMFSGFMLAMLGLGLLGLLAPAWALWRWRGGWRVAAAVPAAMMAFVVLRVMIDTAVDPTSHNLWPFEILQVGAASLVVLGIIALLRRRSLAGA